MENYLRYVDSLKFEATPDYDHCKELFRQGLKDAGYKDDGKLALLPEHVTLVKTEKKKKVDDWWLKK